MGTDKIARKLLGARRFALQVIKFGSRQLFLFISFKLCNQFDFGQDYICEISFSI